MINRKNRTKTSTDLFDLMYGSLMQGLRDCHYDKDQAQNPYREGGEKAKEIWREWREEAWDLGWRSYYKEKKFSKNKQ